MRLFLICLLAIHVSAAVVQVCMLDVSTPKPSCVPPSTTLQVDGGDNSTRDQIRAALDVGLHDINSEKVGNVRKLGNVLVEVIMFFSWCSQSKPSQTIISELTLRR
jgi:hypothetical protein